MRSNSQSKAVSAILPFGHGLDDSFRGSFLRKQHRHGELNMFKYDLAQNCLVMLTLVFDLGRFLPPDGVHDDVQCASALIGVAHFAAVGVVDVDNDKRLLLRLELQLQLLGAALKPLEPASMAAVYAVSLKFAKTF